MLDRLHVIRALTSKVALGFVALTLVLTACSGTTSISNTPTNTPTKAGCKVTAADLAIPGAGAAGARSISGHSGALMIDGSTVIAPLFSDAAKAFQTANHDVTVTVTPDYNIWGLKNVESGAVQIGLSDVFAIEMEDQTNPKVFDDLVDHRVAIIAFTLVVSNDISSKITNLSIEQIQGIYTRQYTNWKQLGGPNEAIAVINRNSVLPAGAGARATFLRYVLGGTGEAAAGALLRNTNAEVAATLSNTPGAIGYVATSFAAMNHSLSPICIDGFGATMANIQAGTYRFWSYEHAYTKGEATGAVDAFLKFVTSDDFQIKNLAARGFLSVNSLSQAAKDTHPIPTAT